MRNEIYIYALLLIFKEQALMIMYFNVLNNIIVEGDNERSTPGVGFTAYPSLFRSCQAFVVTVLTEPIRAVLD